MVSLQEWHKTSSNTQRSLRQNNQLVPDAQHDLALLGSILSQPPENLMNVKLLTKGVAVQGISNQHNFRTLQRPLEFGSRHLSN